MGLRSDAGLLAEEYNPKTNGLMGSFPQPFSHVALTMAVDISRQKGPAVRRSRSGASHKPIPVVVLGRQWIVFGTRQNDERNPPMLFRCVAIIGAVHERRVAAASDGNHIELPAFRISEPDPYPLQFL